MKIDKKNADKGEQLCTTGEQQSGIQKQIGFKMSSDSCKEKLN